jgi:hypothetical protein
MGVPAVDHDVARFQMRQEARDYRIYGLPGWDQEHYFLRRRERCHKAFQIAESLDIVALRFSVHRLGLFGVQVIARRRVSVFCHVQKKIPPHRTEAYHSELRVFHSDYLTANESGG